MNHSQIISIFKRYGAYKRGHFVLSSGLHSEWYLQCALVLAYPQVTEEICKGLAERFRDREINLVIGPALGGIVVAYEVARVLGVKGIFAERDNRGRMALRRDFRIEPGERVLVVEDVVTTGGSIREVIDLVRGAGAKVVGIGAIIDRSDGKVKFGYPFRALARVRIETYQPERCPLCREGVPVLKPGTRWQ